MADSPHLRSIAILDFGGQYAHLIASRIRRFGYPAYIYPSDVDLKELEGVAGIILSGGPQSVYEDGSPQANTKMFDLGVPILGLCYGHQWLAHVLGGKVTPAKVKEYGPTKIRVMSDQWSVASNLFSGLPESFTVWMSHGDEVSKLPKGFVTTASSLDCTNAAMMNAERQIFGIQFHIEVTHTEHGMELLRSFVDLCKPDRWSIKSYAEKIREEIKKEVGDQPSSASGGLRPAGKKVFMLVSGGVDSTVAFTLLNKVLGSDRVKGLLVDTGLMRKNEVAAILEAFKPLGIKNLHVEDASQEFLKNLENVYDPEEKRKLIGNTFLAVQKRVFDHLGLSKTTHYPCLSGRQALPTTHWLLGQGTIYPDTIETGGTKNADKIKTHHNRVDLIQKMIEKGLVIEPLKELYKDEVRQLGEELGLPHELVWRHPFPGPGLGVRILCAARESIEENVEVVSDQWLVASMALPVQSVGVQGDGRTYRHALALFSQDSFTVSDEQKQLAISIPNADRRFNRVLLCTSHQAPFTPVFTPTYITKQVADLLRAADAIADEEMRSANLTEKIWQFPVALLPFGIQKGGRSVVLRPIESTDAMTANAFILPSMVLQKMTERILKLQGIDAVFLDLTNKPPATIEWE